MKQFHEYKYKIVRNLNDEDISHWTKLEDETNPIIFQRVSFVKNWFKNIYSEKEDKLFIIFIYKSEILVSVLPFCIKKSLFFSSLEWIGEPFNDLNFPILRKEISNKLDLYKFLEAILIEFKDEITIIKLKKQIKFFNNNFNPLFNKNSVFSSEKRKVLYLKLNKATQIYSIEKFLDNQYSKLFKRIKRNINKYNLVYKSYKKQDAIHKDRIYNFFLKNKSSKMDRTGVWNYLNFTKYKNFIRDILNSDHSHFSELYDNKELIACHIGFLIKNHYYYIFPAYNENYKKISPGHLSIFYNLKELFNKKNEIIFDFTIGNEGYKDYWSNQEEYLFTNYQYRNFYGKLIVNFFKFLDLNRNSFIFNFLKQKYIKIKK